MKNIKNFNKLFESKYGDFIDDHKYFILEVFDPEEDGFVEYIVYCLEDKKFYLLDPDYSVSEGPFDSLEDLGDEVGIGLDEIPEDWERHIN